MGGYTYPKCETCWQEQALKEKEEEVRLNLELRRQGRRQKAERLRAKIEKVLPPLFAKAHLRDLSAALRGRMVTLPAGKGLYLWGSAGAGKSHAMAALMRRYILSGLSVRRIQWGMLTLELRDTFGQGGTEFLALKPYFESDILLLEDVGTTVSIDVRETDFVLRTLLLLLDERLENCRVTFVTSNKSPEQLGRSFDSRVESRLYACCEIQSVASADKRRSKKV